MWLISMLYRTAFAQNVRKIFLKIPIDLNRNGA